MEKGKYLEYLNNEEVVKFTGSERIEKISFEPEGIKVIFWFNVTTSNEDQDYVFKNKSRFKLTPVNNINDDSGYIKVHKDFLHLMQDTDHNTSVIFKITIDRKQQKITAKLDDYPESLSSKDFEEERNGVSIYY